MSKKHSVDALRGKNIGRGITVIDRRDLPEGKCKLCGAENEELRPYGPKGEWICFDCGMKDKATTDARIGNLLFGEQLPDHLGPLKDKP